MSTRNGDKARAQLQNKRNAVMRAKLRAKRAATAAAKETKPQRPAPSR